MVPIHIIVIFSLLYPLKEKIRFLNKLKAFIILVIIYVGLFFVQYLTWVPVGSHIIVSGVMGRYFIPLLIFLPFIFNLNLNKINKNKFQILSITLAIIFIAAVMMLTLSLNY